MAIAIAILFEKVGAIAIALLFALLFLLNYPEIPDVQEQKIYFQGKSNDEKNFHNGKK